MTHAQRTSLGDIQRRWHSRATARVNANELRRHYNQRWRCGCSRSRRARRRREQEEEATTGYSAQELADGWEFKIVRSATSGFKRPDFLTQVLEEERRAGWTLLRSSTTAACASSAPQRAGQRSIAGLRSLPQARRYERGRSRPAHRRVRARSGSDRHRRHRHRHEALIRRSRPLAVGLGLRVGSGVDFLIVTLDARPFHAPLDSALRPPTIRR